MVAPADPPRSVLIVAGPTASGKSALAMGLAEQLNGVIINADSMQVYRELPILTACPAIEDLARVPHQLYGTLSGDTPCSAGYWRALALKEIEEAGRAGHLPILVGGTGFYLRALKEGIAAVPAVPVTVRDEAEALYSRLGGPAFVEELAERDPESAQRLHPNDRQRLIRAWEVVRATGRPLSAWQRDQGAEVLPAHLKFTTLVQMPERAELYRRCDQRFEVMMEKGALEEVRALMALDYDPKLPVMKSLGVPDLIEYLRGNVELEEAITSAKTKTRRYAKRQMTWLRHQVIDNDRDVILINAQHSESLCADLSNNIRQKVLTNGS